MEQIVQTVLARADTGETKKGRIYKLWDQYGTEYATFTPALWEQARTMLNQPVNITADITTNQFGESRYIRGIQLANGGVQTAPQGLATPTLAPAIPGVFPDPTASPTASTMEPIVAGPEYQRVKHPIEQRAIRKAVALQAAVATLPNLETPLTDPHQVLAIAEVWEQWLAGGPAGSDSA